MPGPDPRSPDRPQAAAAPCPPASQPLIHQGVPEALRPAAAALYWRHFGAQILPMPVAARHGVALIRTAMQPEQALVALSPAGDLLGILGLRDARGGFLDPARHSFVAVWGPAGGRLRHLSTALCRPGGTTGDLVLDGLAVPPRWRRQGIARALVGAAAELARSRGHAGLRAEVAADNHTALSAWRALGFVALHRQRQGWPWTAPAHVLRLALAPSR